MYCWTWFGDRLGNVPCISVNAKTPCITWPFCFPPHIDSPTKQYYNLVSVRATYNEAVNVITKVLGSASQMRGSPFFGKQQAVVSWIQIDGCHQEFSMLKMDRDRATCRNTTCRANGGIMKSLRMISSSLVPVCELMGSR